jgi:hypothetical protein
LHVVEDERVDLTHVVAGVALLVVVVVDEGGLKGGREGGRGGGRG